MRKPLVGSDPSLAYASCVSIEFRQRQTLPSSVEEDVRGLRLGMLRQMEERLKGQPAWIVNIMTSKKMELRGALFPTGLTQWSPDETEVGARDILWESWA